MNKLMLWAFVGPIEFTVDGAQRLRRAPSHVGGVSFHRVCGWTGQPYNKRGDYTLAPELTLEEKSGYETL